MYFSRNNWIQVSYIHLGLNLLWGKCEWVYRFNRFLSVSLPSLQCSLQQKSSNDITLLLNPMYYQVWSMALQQNTNVTKEIWLSSKIDFNRPYLESKQARKLQDAQAEKQTSLQANKLTSWQIYFIRLTNDKMIRWKHRHRQNITSHHFLSLPFHFFNFHHYLNFITR